MKKFERPVLIVAILLLAGALVFSYLTPCSDAIPILPTLPTPYPEPGKTTPEVVLVPVLTGVRPVKPKDTLRLDTVYQIRRDTLIVLDSVAQRKLDSIYANADTLQYDGVYDTPEHHLTYRILAKGPVISFHPTLVGKPQVSLQKNFSLTVLGGTTVLQDAYLTYGLSGSYKSYSALWLRHGQAGHTLAVGYNVKF